MPRVADVAYFNFRPGHSEEWKAAAVCGKSETTDPWYAVGKGSAEARAVGKRICLELCPVRDDCLAYALSAGIVHGTWGGLDEQERGKLPRSALQDALDRCRRMPDE